MTELHSVQTAPSKNSAVEVLRYQIIAQRIRFIIAKNEFD